jgi:hypothetical protein
MKKTITLAMGIILSGLVIAVVHAGPNDGGGTQPAEGAGIKSAQSGTGMQAAPPPNTGLSRRNKAVIERNKTAKMRRDQMQSGATGTTPKNTMTKKSGLSKHNRAVLEQKKAANMRREQMQSSTTGTMPN